MGLDTYIHKPYNIGVKYWFCLMGLGTGADLPPFS